MKDDSGKKQGKLSTKKPAKHYLAHMNAFRAHTKLLREWAGWTTRQLAAKADISQAWVYFIECTEKPVSFAQMVNIADAFGVPVTAMLTPGQFRSKGRRKVS